MIGTGLADPLRLIDAARHKELRELLQQNQLLCALVGPAVSEVVKTSVGHTVKEPQ